MKRQSQKGVALIITLILLSVLTLTTLAFLSMSRRDRGAATTTTDTTSSRLAADAALANAEGQILANALSTTNPYNFGLIVSTNYINSFGYNPVAGANLTNVNYYYPGGAPVAGNDFFQLLANLYYSPRPPVFIQTNSDTSKPLDFRFYLDLNRNGRFDTNGFVPEMDSAGLFTGATDFEIGDPEWIGVLQKPDQPYGPNNPFVARFAFIALPIGNALDLNAIHNQAHRGLPSLPMDSTVNPPAAVANGSDSFIRNEGVGSWEINLAAFLADLNTNRWDPPTLWNPLIEPYQYPGIAAGGSVAFDDARALLAYRYNNDFNTLNLVPNLFGANGATAFGNDNIDGFTYGMPLMTGFHLPGENDSALIAIKAPWVGADNTNHFFTHQELFNTSKTALGVAPAQVVAGNDFSDRLLTAGNGASTYDRYTFYRLLSQLGTDSAPERNKININYSNAVAYFNANEVPTNITIIPGAEANFTAWTPIQFFTIAADKMLRTYSQEWLVSNPQSFTNTFGAITTNVFGITNIPVLINNRFVYTPAVQRVLQLAANIYDATTNNLTVVGNNSRDFPSVFRPIFWVTNENGYANVYINGYEQVASVTGAGDPQLALPVNVADLLLGASVVNYPNGVNVYGVPWIIGAKKGFPNFNEFSMENIVGVTRRLNFTRPTVNAASGAPDLTNFRTNQMYTMCISNLLGVECWNSYTNNYVPVSGNLNIVVRDTLSMTLTNDDGMFPVTTGNIPLNNTKNITFPSYWPGSPLPWDGDGNPSPNSFDIPLLANVVMQLNPPLSPFPGYPGWWAYRFNTHEFLPVPLNPIFETGISGFPFPHFGLLTTNRLQVFMLDGPITGVYHVIDYAHFAGPESARNLTAEIFTDDANGVWNTNASTVGVPNGINNQFSISDVGVLSDAQIREDGIWHPDPEAKPLGGSIADQAAFFDAFFEPGNKSISTSSATVVNLATNVQAPYAPTRYVIEYITWQANDPLVHYIASDLNFTLPPSGDALTPGNNTFNYGKTIPTLTDTNANLGRLNNHYKPWGRSMLAPGTDTNACHLAIKDPLVWQSDDWDFPTNKFPTAGWLGRVHRGTPWQTVYLKSTDILMETNVLFPNIGFTTWTNWSGDLNPFDAINFAPVQDRRLFDFFTTAFNDNATRGQLSVNVGAPNGPSLAAWSALFSGVIALSNNAVSTAPGGISSFNPLTEEGVQRNGSLANFMALPPIDPAGTAGAGSVLGGLVANINATREAFTNVYGVPAFEHVGDILAVPQLTVQSPFLNRSDSIQQMNGISDEMYEWLPQQVMSLLRCSSSPRYVIYSYGQTLKPAPNSIYTGSGPFFQMVTNYQVISETATRAVVRFNSTLTNVVSTNASGAFTVTNQVINNNAVIEGFNVLPPD